jgi:hypothetical protein
VSRQYTPVFSAIRHSGKLADLPDDSARLLFLMLLPQCDDWGRAACEPRKVQAEVWPLLAKTVEETARCLDLLEKVGLIERLTDGTLKWLQIPDWETKAGTVGRKSHRWASEWPSEGSRMGFGADAGGTGRNRADAGGPGARTEQKRAEKTENRADSALAAEPPPKRPSERVHHPSEAEKVWQASWAACRLASEPYELTAADCIALNKIAAKHGLERLRAKADALLSDLEPFTFKNASPTLLVKRWSNLGQGEPRRTTQAELNLQATARVADRIDEIEAQARARRQA